MSNFHWCIYLLLGKNKIIYLSVKNIFFFFQWKRINFCAMCKVYYSLLFSTSVAKFETFAAFSLPSIKLNLEVRTSSMHYSFVLYLLYFEGLCSFNPCRVNGSWSHGSRHTRWIQSSKTRWPGQAVIKWFIWRQHAKSYQPWQMNTMCEHLTPETCAYP